MVKVIKTFIALVIIFVSIQFFYFISMVILIYKNEELVQTKLYFFISGFITPLITFFTSSFIDIWNVLTGIAIYFLFKFSKINKKVV
jgi:hypothetical protein